MRLLLSFMLIVCPLAAHASLADAVARVMPTVVSIEHDGKAVCAGVIVDRRRVVTARHCIQPNTQDVALRLADGRHITGRLVGVATIDIAVLRIVESTPLPAVTLGNASALRPGDPVFAIGHPLRYRFTVTAGIVSFVDRDDGDQSGLSLQTDAVIHPGNSGGPLFDAEGRLVGINFSGIMSRERIGVGLNFAIPVHAMLAAMAEIERL